MQKTTPNHRFSVPVRWRYRRYLCKQQEKSTHRRKPVRTLCLVHAMSVEHTIKSSNLCSVAIYTHRAIYWTFNVLHCAVLRALVYNIWCAEHAAELREEAAPCITHILVEHKLNVRGTHIKSVNRGFIRAMSHFIAHSMRHDNSPISMAPFTAHSHRLYACKWCVRMCVSLSATCVWVWHARNISNICYYHFRVHVFDKYALTT